jgi:arylsulfatase A-like enzyme
VKRILKFILKFALSVIAIGFFWGAVEALLNYYVTPAEVPRAFYLLESINDRAVFYIFVALIVLTAAAVVSAIMRFSADKAADNKYILAFPILFGIILAVSSNLFWLVLSNGRVVHGFARLGNLWLTQAAWRMVFLSAVFYVVGATAFFIFLKVRDSLRLKPVLYAIGAAFLFVLLALRGAAAYEGGKRPVPSHLPDVYVISIDACRADSFNEETAPRLTEYASKNCVVFGGARAPTSWTTPSFAAMFTGQYPDACTRGGFFMGRGQPTLAEILYDNGYDTYLITGNPALTPPRGLPRGFRYFSYWGMSPLLESIRYYETNFYYALSAGYDLKMGPGVINEIISARADAIIDGKGTRPKFVWIHYLDPHSPYYPDAAYVPRKYGKYAEDPELCLSDDVYTPENAEVLKELYKGEIRMLDDEVIALIESIEASGDHVIVFTSDHGEEFYEHGRFKHGKSVYEEVLRVPLFIKLPSGMPGSNGPRVVERDVNVAALAPTLLEMLGFDIPASMQFVSLFAEPGDSRGMVFSGSKMHTGESVYAVIEGNKKLVAKKADLEDGGEYYNLSMDPGENDSLPFDETAINLRKALIEWVDVNAALRKAQVSGRAGEISKDDFRALGYVK